METFFFKEALVRTSVRPVEFILKLLEENYETWLEKLGEDAYFMNSLFLASPSLYDKFLSIRDVPDNHKDYLSLKNSLLKYAKRISTRSTPFGLFSGCEVVKIGDSDLIEIGEIQDFKYHTSLDMEFSVRLASLLSRDKKLQKFLVYSPNTSMYQIGSANRLVSYSLSENKNRKYQLISIIDEVEMMNLLEFCVNGKTYKKIQHFLLEKGYPEEDVLYYLNDLIESHVLISDLEPSSLGKDFEHQIIDTLKDILLLCDEESEKKYIKEKLGVLTDIVNNYPKNISEITSNIGFLREKEKEIFSRLNELENFSETKNLLQIDLQTHVNSGEFSQKLLKKVEHILPIIQKLRRTEPNPTQGRLRDFKKAFTERYDTRAVPLTEVLDVEVGIGYGGKLKNNSGDNHPLIDNLPRDFHGKNSEEIIWNERIDSFWIDCIKEAFENDSNKIQLSKSSLQQFEERPLDYSASFVVKTTILKKQEEDYLHVEFFGGHTSTIWLGRFCNGNSNIRELYNKITAHEENEFCDFEVAEIDHLPQAKLGNVVLRPNNRKNVISYVVHDKTGKSGGKVNNIPLTDLLVIVENDKVFLKSKATDRFVIPYYSNAFNIGLNDNLPVFQFLADVTREYTNLSGSIDLSHLHRIFDFIPRVEYDNLVLNRASWRIKSEVFAGLRKFRNGELLEKFQKICLKYKLPELFIFKKGDNELLVKGNNQDSVQAFLSEVPKIGNIHLTEFLLSEFESGVKDKSGNNYNNEVLLFAGSKQKEKFIPRRRTNITKDYIKEEFKPGSEWIYYKIYLGYKSADLVLKLLSQFLKNKGEEFKIEKWFFLRYYDPDFHIRLRIKVKDRNSVALAFLSMGEFFEQIEKEHQLGKVMIDTYVRELMRYGYQMIDVFEDIFYFDSVLCLEMIDYFNQSTKYTTEDLWLGGLVTMNFYCEVFLKDTDKILHFVETSKERYAQEFGANVATKKEINKRYSENRTLLNSTFLEMHEQDLIKMMNHRRKSLVPLVTKIAAVYPEDLNYYLSSIIHMNVNRMFRKNQRLYEYLLFDFLFKILTTKKHLEKKRNLVNTQ